MTLHERIVAFLQEHPEGVDDDALAEAMQPNSRQDVNKVCRQLTKESLVTRRRVNGKIHNFWVGDKPFQRKGAKSNTHVGREFEKKVKAFLANQGLNLKEGISIEIGINGTKPHSFDLGSRKEKILVECKSHTWTEGGNVPSAKLTTWDQAMYMFVATPAGYRKVFFTLKDWNPKKKETLAGYYVRTKSHLIPEDVEIWEFDEINNKAIRLK